MNLSPHFTLHEATVSQTAARMGIDNTPTGPLLDAVRQTATFMERVRSVLGHPIVVTSWYRCPDLERAITGLAPGRPLSGHHPKGAAVDFICPAYGSPLDVATRLSAMVDPLGVGQLIYEYGAWVHISRLPVAPVNRIITIDQRGVQVGIVP
jgi:zinc D-Ala-D-Ala carboxypeptidase